MIVITSRDSVAILLLYRCLRHLYRRYQCFFSSIQYIIKFIFLFRQFNTSLNWCFFFRQFSISLNRCFFFRQFNISLNWRFFFVNSVYHYINAFFFVNLIYHWTDVFVSSIRFIAELMKKNLCRINDNHHC